MNLGMNHAWHFLNMIFWPGLPTEYYDVRVQNCIKCLRENVKILTKSWLSVSSVQIQELGLQYQYNHDWGTYLYLRKFMALPFLLEDNIQPMFEHLHLKATTDPWNPRPGASTWWPSGATTTWKGGTMDSTVVLQADGICHFTSWLVFFMKRPAWQRYECD